MTRNKDIMINVRLEKETKEKLGRMAFLCGMSMGGTINELINANYNGNGDGKTIQEQINEIKIDISLIKKFLNIV
jgi:hypothetical protein